MKRVFEIKTDPRLVARRVKTAIQGNAIRALVELITNCDDSYRILEGENVPLNGRIDVLYQKEGYCGRFAVRDNAAGMSYIELSHAFEKYGAATSGFKAGKAVTGFFGTGAKNALAGMTDGRICTFKDDMFTECRVFLDGNRLKGEIDDDAQPATAALRSKHEIDANGTVAYFMADPDKGQQVPQFNTVFQYLANHWRLRKIMTNRKRKVALFNVGENLKKRRLTYGLQGGKEVLVEQFSVPVDGYGDFPIRFSLSRAETELLQSGDERGGGLLILDEAESVLDMSLFKYDNEPLASRFFGEVVIGRFRELLERESEEPVLKEEREGLDRSHLVCRAIVSEIEKRIERMVKEEQCRQRKVRSEIDIEENRRYRDAFNILNEIAESEVDVVNLGQEPTDQIEPPPNGLGIYPDSAHITVGKRYGFQIRMDTRVIRPGALVKVSCNGGKVRLISKSEFSVPLPEENHLAMQYVTVEGAEAGVRATLSANVGKRTAEAIIIVDPEKEEKEELLSEGLVFRPQSLNVRMNRVRKAVLLVYVKIIEGDSRVLLTSDNENVHVSPDSIVVNEADTKRRVAEYEVEVWGDRVNATGLVTATAQMESSIALLEVRVKKDDEVEKKKLGKGMFSEPYFDLLDPEPLQRSSYSRETGSVTIYAHFPSVKHYLGDGCCHRKTLGAQVLIADLVAERCFLEVAKEKVERIAILGIGEKRTARIQSETQALSKRHGHRVHKALVDQNLLKEDRTKSERLPQ